MTINYGNEEIILPIDLQLQILKQENAELLAQNRDLLKQLYKLELIKDLIAVETATFARGADNEYQVIEYGCCMCGMICNETEETRQAQNHRCKECVGPKIGPCGADSICQDCSDLSHGYIRCTTCEEQFCREIDGGIHS